MITTLSRVRYYHRFIYIHVYQFVLLTDMHWKLNLEQRWWSPKTYVINILVAIYI